MPLHPYENKLCIIGILNSEIISSDLMDFFPLESNGEGLRSKLEWEDGQSYRRQKKRHVQAFEASDGATSPSCKVTRAIRNVHDQPESVRSRPAVVNPLRLVEFKTIRSLKFFMPGTSDVMR